MEIVAATGNTHKLAEFARILEPLGYIVVGRDKYCADDDAEETGLTFAENAMIKAMAVFRATGKPCIADDSGLCVDYLGGAPGIYSARYSGEHGNSAENNRKLLRELEGVPDEKRGAAFVCAVCCVFGENDIVTADGRCEGSIAFAERGEGGFGYDPLFLAGERTVAELSDTEKDAISHRGQALRMLAQKLAARDVNITQEEK